jgi:hypothetical protein
MITLDVTLFPRTLVWLGRKDRRRPIADDLCARRRSREASDPVEFSDRKAARGDSARGIVVEEVEEELEGTDVS